MNKKVIIPIISIAVLIIIGISFILLNNVKYTITFNTNGGTAVESIEVKKNQTIDKLPITNKDGYTFLYWTLEGNKFNSDTKITKDITLVAYFQKKEEQSTEVKTYTVKFNTDGGSKIESIKVEKNNTLTKPEDPTKTGYIFDKWVLNNKEYDFDTKVTTNITLKATWKKQEESKNKYTVSFNTDGGTSISSQTIEEGNKATKPTDPVKDGYTFNGWLLDGNSYDFNSSVTSNITLTATWKEVVKTYTISISLVDSYSPDRYLTVKENGNPIKISKLMYTDGTNIDFGSDGYKVSVNVNDIDGVTEFEVQLSNGNIVKAKVE